MSEEPPSNAALEDGVVTPLRRRYEALQNGLEAPRLMLRAGDGCLSIPYYEIGAIVLDLLAGTVRFSIKDEENVTIQGRNLEPIFDALHRHGCSRVQEFDARRFLPPGNANDPFVERIDVAKPKTKAKADEKA